MLVIPMATAFVCINCDATPPPDMLKKVRAVEGVEEPEMVYGLYDICFKVKAETSDKIKKIITERILKIDNIRRILTEMLIESK